MRSTHFLNERTTMIAVTRTNKATTMTTAKIMVAGLLPRTTCPNSRETRPTMKRASITTLLTKEWNREAATISPESTPRCLINITRIECAGAPANAITLFKVLETNPISSNSREPILIEKARFTRTYP